MKTWVKLYTEINRDPDMSSLSWAHRGIWQALLALCGELDDRDENEVETGRLDTPSRIAWYIRCDATELETALAAFEERGMITRNGDGVLYLPNYPKRQGRPASSRPSAVTERVKRHRAKEQRESNEPGSECNEDVTTLHRAVTTPDPETDPDPETETEKKESGANAPSPGGDPPPPLPITFQGWAERIQSSKNRQADLVVMFEALYPGRDPPDFGYIGKVARAVGGAGRLAELLWQHSTKPPSGDVLAYIQASVKKGGNGRATDSGRGGRTDKVIIQGHIPRAATPEEFYGTPPVGPG